jgi:hypothetical protein
MINTLTKHRITKHQLLLKFIFLLLTLFIVNSSFADEKEDEDFPWEVFYPAFINKPIDNDRDGFTEKQGDCNDLDPNINPNAAEICGDEIDQDCDGSDLPCPLCINIAGSWYASETVTLTCCIYGNCETDTFSGTDTITIQQNGCNISYDLYISGYGTFSRTGTIDANNIHLSGLFVVLQPWCTATQNVVNADGAVNGDQINLHGSGIANGTCDGDSFSCTGSSNATLTRLSPLNISKEMIGKESDSEAFTPFLNNYFKILTAIAH